jgi:trans-feruloyl-CoA hydratase/vanillin synthase
MPLKPNYQTVKVEKENGITWVILNRPEKRNAISPQLCFDMEDVLMCLETDDETRVVVLTGAGPAFSAGMDLKEYFRANDNNPDGQFRAYNANKHWQWDILSMMRKPTIAMVNGFCFGGAFTPLVGCDLAIAADEARFGLSEVNWGILPGGIVSKVVQMTMGHRDAVFYSMTGRFFSGKEAAAMKLVNMSVPLAQLREETVKICNELIEKPPMALAYTKQAIRAVTTMDVPASAEYLQAKSYALRWIDRDKDARNQGIEKFIDKKEYRPGLQTVKVT